MDFTQPFPRTEVQGYSDSFFLVNNVKVDSSVILLPHTWYCWNLHDVGQLSFEALKVFTLIKPRLEMLILGVDGQPDGVLDDRLHALFRGSGIVLTEMATVRFFVLSLIFHACVCVSV